MVGVAWEVGNTRYGLYSWVLLYLLLQVFASAFPDELGMAGPSVHSRRIRSRRRIQWRSGGRGGAATGIQPPTWWVGAVKRSVSPLDAPRDASDHGAAHSAWGAVPMAPTFPASRQVSLSNHARQLSNTQQCRSGRQPSTRSDGKRGGHTRPLAGRKRQHAASQIRELPSAFSTLVCKNMYPGSGSEPMCPVGGKSGCSLDTAQPCVQTQLVVV